MKTDFQTVLKLPYYQNKFCSFGFMDKQMGRPLLFETPTELQNQVDNYFEQEDKPTLAGLAYHLGIDRQTLYNYKEREDFFDIIKGATDRVAAKYEQRLVYENNPTGVIFALKNMGWKDKSETELSGELGIKQITGMQVL